MLTAVDRVAITIVIDNFLDVLMAGEDRVTRYQARDFGAPEQLVAEHGFSALVTVEHAGDRQTLLYDAGMTPHAVARNLDESAARRKSPRLGAGRARDRVRERLSDSPGTRRLWLGA